MGYRSNERFKSLRSSANASQSPCDASFIAEGETDGFTHRAPLPQRSRTDPADRSCEWAKIIKARCSSENAATYAQMPTLQSSICPPGSSWPASFGNARPKEEIDVTEPVNRNETVSYRV